MIINTIWVGPPSTTTTTPGHDTQGIRSLASKTPEDQFKFWCLDEYAEHYRELFANNKNIEVVGIKSHLHSLSEEGIKKIHSDNKNPAAEVLKIMDVSLSESRNSIRDRVNVKEALGYFILWNEGGYLLDTNVEANQGTPNFKEYPCVMAPIVKTNAPLSQPTPDVWAIYSPKNNQHMQHTLDQYIASWFLLEKDFNNIKNEEDEKDYYKRCGESVVDSLILKNDPNNIKEGVMFWRTKADDDLYFVKVPALNVTKFYYNTHKHKYKDSEKPHQIFMDIKHDLSERVKNSLDNGTNVDQLLVKQKELQHPVIEETLQETPLLKAIRLKRINSVKVLLEHSPNLDIPAKYLLSNNRKDKTYTPLELATLIGDDETINLVSEYYKKSKHEPLISKDNIEDEASRSIALFASLKDEEDYYDVKWKLKSNKIDINKKPETISNSSNPLSLGVLLTTVGLFSASLYAYSAYSKSNSTVNNSVSNNNPTKQ